MRIGILGGTFDPPHIAHLILAQEACSQLSLDRLLWVLTPSPPHKRIQVITSSDHRLAMLQAALEGNAEFELSHADLDRLPPHYSLDTLRVVRRQHPQAELIYLMGGDSLHDLPEWHRPAEFVAACDALGIVRRPDDCIDLQALETQLPGIGEKLRFVAAPLLEISSTDIRIRAAEGRPFRYFLPPQVYTYILQHGLYRPAKP